MNDEKKQAIVEEANKLLAPTGLLSQIETCYLRDSEGCDLESCVDCGYHKLVVKSANSLQQLKAEIAALQQLKAEIAADMKNVLFNHQDYSHTELVAIIEGWQRQLSAV